MKKQRKTNLEEMNKLKMKRHSICSHLGMYPYEMYTLLSSYALSEDIPFDMGTYMKL